MGIMTPKPKHVRTTAFHESGHAVIARYRSRGHISLTIVPGDGFLGASGYGSFSDYDQIDELRIALGGPIAEWLYTGRWNHRGALADFVKVVAWHCAYRDHTSETEADRELKWCADWAGETLDSKWSAVDALAQAALASGTLDHEQIVSIVDRATLTKLDPPRRRWNKHNRDGLIRHLSRSDARPRYEYHAFLDLTLDRFSQSYGTNPPRLPS